MTNNERNVLKNREIHFSEKHFSKNFKYHSKTQFYCIHAPSLSYSDFHTSIESAHYNNIEMLRCISSINRNFARSILMAARPLPGLDQPIEGYATIQKIPASAEIHISSSFFE